LMMEAVVSSKVWTFRSQDYLNNWLSYLKDCSTSCSIIVLNTQILWVLKSIDHTLTLRHPALPNHPPLHRV
jgi:hypothetical protein